MALSLKISWNHFRVLFLPKQKEEWAVGVCNKERKEEKKKREAHCQRIFQ